jgi:hypothetical protein
LAADPTGGKDGNSVDTVSLLTSVHRDKVESGAMTTSSDQYLKKEPAEGHFLHLELLKNVSIELSNTSFIRV